MEIKKKEMYNKVCDGCITRKKTIKIELRDLWFYLCDECLQELNLKIVDYLADKNI